MRHYEQARDHARGMTASLCLLLAAAVVGTIVISALAMACVTVAVSYGYMDAFTEIVMPTGYWEELFVRRALQGGILTALVVLGTACYRTWQLGEEGGRGVARSLGGSRVLSDATDPAHIMTLHVVEELAVATSLRPPALYVLEDEPGINAFAAGLDARDAVVGVTRGAIDRLKRHQLEGVIAHEFSHILNEDIRLNLRLLGVLTGIQAITSAARYLLRLGLPEGAGLSTTKHPLGMALALAFGLALWPIGQVGALFATLIHLAVNRQREFLADASAVQITRDPEGLREALRVVLDEGNRASVRGPAAAAARHMFFASGRGGWERLFATHPPLAERIRRLDPTVASPLTDRRPHNTLPADRPGPAGRLTRSGQESASPTL